MPTNLLRIFSDDFIVSIELYTYELVGKMKMLFSDK